MLGPGQARSLDSRAEQWEVIELERSVHHLVWCLRDPAGGRGLTGLQEGGMGTGDPGTELTLIPLPLFSIKRLPTSLCSFPKIIPLSVPSFPVYISLKYPAELVFLSDGASSPGSYK